MGKSTNEYRLKKWYPALRDDMEEGDVVRKCESKVNLSFGKVEAYAFQGEEAPFYISKEEVENYPEFWEAIEKNYKILSVKNKQGELFDEPRYDMKTPKEGIAFYSPKKRTWIDPYNLSEGQYIHSVKRLSDGEVFTVGDMIEGACNKGSITGFSIRVNFIVVYFGEKFSQFFHKVSHLKDPLFTTEDGVDIYEGDEVYKVANNKSTLEAFIIDTATISEKPCTDYWLYFSTKEKAKKYIEKYKPQYSKADITEAFEEALKKSDASLHLVLLSQFRLFQIQFLQELDK